MGLRASSRAAPVVGEAAETLKSVDARGSPPHPRLPTSGAMPAMYPVVALVPMQVVFQSSDAAPVPPPAALTSNAEDQAGRWTRPDAPPRKQCVEAFKKTAICRYYPRCHLGETCRFAHSPDELRTRPNLTKTRMCAGYCDGRCRLPASKCGFAHGKHDLRPREVPVFKDPPSKISQRAKQQKWEEESTTRTPSTTDGSSPSCASSEDALGSIEFFTEADDCAASDATPPSTPRVADGLEADLEQDVAAVSDLVRQWVEEIKMLGGGVKGHTPSFFATQGECEAALEMSMPEVYEDPAAY